MQYKIPERVTGCGNLQQCPVELALRIHVASGTVLTGNAPDWVRYQNSTPPSPFHT